MMFMGAFVTGMVEGPRLCVLVRCWRFKNCYVKRGFSCKCKKISERELVRILGPEKALNIIEAKKIQRKA